VRVNAPDSETEVDKQISILETYIEQGVDIIITGPCSQTAIVDTIKKADEKGIPVFLVDSGADESPYISFVGTNNYEGGKLGADWIGKNVKGKVAVLDGFSGNDATTQRFKGFSEQIKKYPDVTVVASEYGNCELSKGMEVAENFLIAYPDLAGIFTVNDMMAIGAGQAVEAAGKRDQIKVCGFDGQPDAAQKIIEGTIDATIAQKPATMGKLIVDKVADHLRNNKVDRIIDTGCDIVEKADASKYLQWQ
jgi:ribose transport system substrate-binding protein